MEDRNSDDRNLGVRNSWFRLCGKRWNLEGISFWSLIANIDNKKSEANAPLVLLKVIGLISRSAVVCGSLYLGQHRRTISPCTLCYKTRKGPSYQKLSHKVGSQRQTLCIENKAKPIYLTLDNEDNLSTWWGLNATRGNRGIYHLEDRA